MSTARPKTPPKAKERLKRTPPKAKARPKTPPKASTRSEAATRAAATRAAKKVAAERAEAALARKRSRAAKKGAATRAAKRAAAAELRIHTAVKPLPRSPIPQRGDPGKTEFEAYAEPPFAYLQLDGNRLPSNPFFGVYERDGRKRRVSAHAPKTHASQARSVVFDRALLRVAFVLNKKRPKPKPKKSKKPLTPAEKRAANRLRVERSHAAKKGWRTRKLRAYRASFDPELGITTAAHLKPDQLKGAPPEYRAKVENSRRSSWHRLRALIEARDQRWLDFLDYATDLDFDYGEAADEWFSPEWLG